MIVYWTGVSVNRMTCDLLYQTSSVLVDMVFKDLFPAKYWQEKMSIKLNCDFILNMHIYEQEWFHGGRVFTP